MDRENYAYSRITRGTRTPKLNLIDCFTVLLPQQLYRKKLRIEVFGKLLCHCQGVTGTGKIIDRFVCHNFRIALFMENFRLEIYEGKEKNSE